MFELLNLLIQVGGAIAVGAAVGTAVCAILITLEHIYEEYVKPLFIKQTGIDKIDGFSYTDLERMVYSAIQNTEIESKRKQYNGVLAALQATGTTSGTDAVVMLGYDHNIKKYKYKIIEGEVSHDFQGNVQRFDRQGNVRKIRIY